jgi:hypothetical protein
MVEPELVKKKPCSCGAMVLHFRIPGTSDEYWRCENVGFSCVAFGKTYEKALEASTAAPPRTKISAATRARLDAMLDTRIDAIADAELQELVTEAFNDCLNGLAASKSEEGAYHVIGHTVKVLFMLGRLSAMN